MKITRSIDGKNRATIRLEVRISISDIQTAIRWIKDDNKLLNKNTPITKKTVLNKLKYEMTWAAKDKVDYYDSNDSEQTISEAIKLAEKLFPNLD